MNKKSEQKDTHSNNPSDPAKWVDLYGDLLFRYALVRLRDPALAEDVVQETLLSALQSRQSFSGRSTERTWMVGILKHKIIDYFRKTSREQNLGDDDPPENIDEQAFKQNGRWRNGPAAWTQDSSVTIENKEFWETLKQCLSQLPSRLANIFVLRELEEMNSQEICKVFDVTATNLWVLLHRARQRLRGCLETNWFGHETGKE